MRIIYLSGFILPSRAAHGMHAMKMCQALARNGHEVTLFAWGRRRDRTDDLCRDYGVDPVFAVKLLPVARVRGGTLLSLPRLYRELRTYVSGDTLVYARSPYGASLAARLGFPIVYEAHCPPPHILIHELEKRLLRGRNLQKLVVISESLQRIYLSTYGPIPHLEVCHDAADIPSPAVAVEYPWPGRADRLQVGYAGHLFRGRGIEVILECARRLPQYDFHIAGGTEPDIRYWRRLGSENVHFHGFVQPLLVPTVLSRCDVLLAPYRIGLSHSGRKIDTSGWMSPMKLFEYMAARRAIIVSDLPVLREVLREDLAILVAPEEPDDWVSALRRCEDRDCRDRLAAAAYEEFLAKYTWEKRAALALAGVRIGASTEPSTNQ